MDIKPTPFDLTGPLPQRTLVIEASAGTGKTYTLSALALRYIAEGHATIDEMVMITFSRLAASELRSRIYARLRGARDALRAYLREGEMPTDDVDSLLCQPERDAGLALELIESAISGIDDAVIDTIHGFCARMLRDFRAVLPTAPPSQFSNDLSQLKQQAIHDTYLIQRPKIAFDEFSRLADLALGDASLAIVSPDPGDDSLIDALNDSRMRFAARKLDEDVMDFSDVIIRLRDALLDAHVGGRLATLMATKYRKVLVDEFQDTDVNQWLILRHAFAGASTLVLIGDPKQSIYKFRGADVFAYLDAVRQATDVATLSTNHRSDPSVVAGVDALFAEANLGTPDAPIGVPPVDPSIAGARLTTGDPTDTLDTGALHSDPVNGDPTGRLDRDTLNGDSTTQKPAVRIRVINTTSTLPVRQARRLIDDDLCESVINLLDEAKVCSDGRWRRIRASDIAVLVSANRRGEEIVAALNQAGVAAVFSGAASVFATPSATTWLALLDAVSDPTSPAVGRVAVSDLVGYGLGDLAGQSALITLRSELTTCQETYLHTGPTGVFESLALSHNMTGRVLGQTNGERIITDTRHLGELLQTQWQRTHCSSARLADWLTQMTGRARSDNNNDERTRRVETDRLGVQVMTVHAAKGLEFPVVLLPQAADSPPPRQSRGVIVHRGGNRVLDIGAPRLQEAVAENQREEDAETKRKLYVGFTRARSLAVAWWAPTKKNLSGSGLALLCGVDGSSGSPRPPATVSDATVAVELVSPAPLVPRTPPPPPTNLLAVRSFTRSVDRDWTRTSYSGLTDGLHDFLASDILGHDDAPSDISADASAEIEELDNGSPVGSAAATATTTQRHVSPLSDMPAGTQFGLIVHEALEHLDTNPETLETDMASLTQRFVSHSPLPGLEAPQLAAGLLAVMRTPLGELTHGRCLAQIPSSDRLAELSFELPLGSERGEAGHPSGSVPLRNRTSQSEMRLPGFSIQRNRRLVDLATLFRDRSLVPRNDPLASYGDTLSATEAADRVLSGWLTGSIDALLRLPNGQFVIVDYKTNRFPTPDGSPLYAEQYSPSAMATAMIAAHYPLQALLYCVAVSRFLSQRIPDFNCATHLAGVGYLFVRGMIGPETPVIDGQPCGVFTWHPTPELIAAASTVLAGGAVS